MKKQIDARGLACPEPVLLTRKALGESNEVIVIVDDTTALENVKRLASGMGCECSDEQKTDGIHIQICRKEGALPEKKGDIPVAGPTVVVVPNDGMGRGNDDLGSVLIKSFLHALTEVSPKPDMMIFFNTGIKLTVKGSDVADDIKSLEQGGVRVLVCGTCLNFFNQKENLIAGQISNMYDIAESMLGAGRIISV